MREAVPHIMSPLSAPWCAWTMLFLFICAILSEILQPGIISKAYVSIKTKAERTYKEAPSNFTGQILINIFRVGTLAMAIYLCLYAKGDFEFIKFILVCSVIVGVVVIKLMLSKIIDFTFLLSRRFPSIGEHYANLVTFNLVVIFPILLVLFHFGNPILNKWILGGIIIIFIGIWLYRSIRIFCSSPMAIIYLIIYFCTLELLPIASILFLSEKTISYI